MVLNKYWQVIPSTMLSSSSPLRLGTFMIKTTLKITWLLVVTFCCVRLGMKTKWCIVEKQGAILNRSLYDMKDLRCMFLAESNIECMESRTPGTLTWWDGWSKDGDDRKLKGRDVKWPGPHNSHWSHESWQKRLQKPLLWEPKLAAVYIFWRQQCTLVQSLHVPMHRPAHYCIC